MPRKISSKPPGYRSELDVIAGVRARTAGAARGVVLGIGDDCAVLRPAAGQDVVVTTDFSLEGRHFRRDWHTAAQVGHRTLARGLSDLAAMGAKPLAAFLSLALPRGVKKSWVDGFLDGLMALATATGTPLAGGDTAQAPGGEVLADIVLLGTVARGKALRRDGARAGDGLYVTGTLGGAAAELKDLKAKSLAGQKSAFQPLATRLRLDGAPGVMQEPRLGVGQALVRRGLATACIDVSDGLSTDLGHLCAASGVGAEVEEARLPMDALAGGAVDALKLALHGGEDYELLFTARAAAKVPGTIAGVVVTRIGTMTKTSRGKAGTVMLLRKDGRREALAAQGWEHKF